MRRIGEMSNVIVEIDAQRRRLRAEAIKRHNLMPDVSCVSCGDTGMMLDLPGHCCLLCEIGREIAEHRERDGKWQVRIPHRFRGYSLDSHPDHEAVERVRSWIMSGRFVGQSLILSGPVGTGKTGLAIGALREVFVSGDNVHYGTVPDLLEALRPIGPGDPEPTSALSALQRVPVLLMDDLGTEKSTEWVAERLYLMINGRYERSLPTIVTTNRRIEELAATIGERATSRLLEDYLGVVVDGPDRRRAGTARNRPAMAM